MQDSSGLDEEQKAQEDSGNALESLAAVERRNADTPMLAALAEQKSTHSSQQQRSQKSTPAPMKINISSQPTQRREVNNSGVDSGLKLHKLGVV